jgi:hypothetical protein
VHHETVSAASDADMTFRVVIFYPMSAVITIFCNLLLYPLNTNAEQDLELLRSAPELIRGIRARRLTLNEIIHMKMIEDFVAELVRLGGCAIQKAREEQGFKAHIVSIPTLLGLFFAGVVRCSLDI